MFAVREMKRQDMDEVLEMMKVFYASPAVLHKAPETVLRQDIEDCIGDMPYVEGYVFTDGKECDIEELQGAAELPRTEELQGAAELPRTEELQGAAELQRTEELQDETALRRTEKLQSATKQKVLLEMEKIVGYAMVAKGYSTEYGGLCLWVEDLYMKPEYRHQGLGTLFFSYLEKKYRDKAVRYRLEVEEENQAAVAAYKKNGYQLLPYLEMTKEV